MIITYRTYTFRIAVTDYMNLPFYKGSTFRGAFGSAFKRIVCTLRQKECPSCMLKNQCIYAYIFETMPPDNTAIMGMSKYEKVPHPFIIEPPAESKQSYRKGEELTFALVLIGKAVDYLPYFILTFEELGRIGLGRGRGKYALLSVATDKSVVYSSEDKTIHRFEPRIVEISESFDGNDFRDLPESTVGIELLTPMRIMYKRSLASSLEFHVLLRNLMRRLSLLHYFHCEQKSPAWNHNLIIDASLQVEIKKDNTCWYDWERYSSRQNTKMKMGGIVGNISYQGVTGPFTQILRVGEIVHAGKGTSFGLGKYRIMDSATSAS
jgi:hypothetical protein